MKTDLHFHKLKNLGHSHNISPHNLNPSVENMEMELLLNETLPAFTPYYFDRMHEVTKKIILMVAIFGVLGNIVNIYVLTRKRTRRWSRGTLEDVAYTGLVALAISDMMYCLMSVLDAVVVDRRRTLHYNIHVSVVQYCSKYVLNLFSYFSTWLTVLMALNRYLAICHPIYTRICVRRNLLWKVMLLIFLSWAVLLLPELLERKISYSNCSHFIETDFNPNMSHLNSTNFVDSKTDCNPNISHLDSTDFVASETDFNPNVSHLNGFDFVFSECRCMNLNGSSYKIYQLQAGPTDDTRFLTVSQVFNNIVGFIIPAAIMIYCNFHIVLKLQETRRMRREIRCLEISERRSSNHTMPDKPVTFSLFMVVLLFLILVTPSEVVNMLYRYCHMSYSDLIVLNVVGEIANIMNTLNFATNFLLYCLVNVHFRHALRMMCCSRQRRVSREMSFMMCTRATSVDLL